MCFIEREPQNIILKFSKIFPWRETVLRAHGMKWFDLIFVENGTCCDWQVFFFISERFEDFS